MSDDTTTPTEQPDQDATDEPTEPAQAPDEPVDATDWKAEARKWEQRAKDNKRAADELAQQRKATMTEAERLAVEAEERGRQAVRAEYGQRLVRSEYLTAAARRNAGFDAALVLDDLNLSKFVTDDGEPDADAIRASVARLVPEPVAAPAAPVRPQPNPSQGRPISGDDAAYEQFYPSTPQR